MKRLAITLLILIAGLTCLILVSTKVSGQTTETITYDVSCDGRTFAINQVHDGNPSIQRGDTFLLSGNIYAGNTIPAGGTRQDPSPFGPDHSGAVGTWICRGVFLAGGDSFKTEKIQRATTQYFVLTDKSRLFTEGFEGPIVTTRAVVGGIGTHAGARGTATMERIGINKTGSYNLRIVFTLE